MRCVTRLQLKATQAAAAAAAASSPAAGSAAGMEELHAQVLRLKRQRDKLTRGQQELSRALAEAQEAAALARQEAAAAKVRGRSLCGCSVLVPHVLRTIVLRAVTTRRAREGSTCSTVQILSSTRCRCLPQLYS
jgi:hypothetical protein